MSFCPSCGADISGRDGCRACGATLDDAVRTDGSGGPNDWRDQQLGNPDDRPQDGGQHQPRGGGRRQPRGGRQGGQSDQGGRPPQQRQRPGENRPGPPSRQDGDGTTRRRLLLGGGGTLAVLGGLWLVVGGDDESDGGPGPETVVEQYLDALSADEFERAAELIHEDSPEHSLDQSDRESYRNVNYTVERTEIVDREIQYDAAEFATVQAFETVEVEFTGSLNGQERNFTEVVVVAQNTDGEWRIWN